MRAKVSAKGWIVIPAPLRKKDPIEEAHGMLAEGPSLTQELLDERAEELQREEAKSRCW